MQTFIQNLSTFLEIINWISGILIAVFAFVGLKQLSIAKETLAISSKRDAFKLTADKVSIFAEKIIPLTNALDKKIAEENITFFTEAKVNIEGNSIKVKMPMGEKHVNDIVKISSEVTNLINSLEAFALYFISGVASEGLAFSSIGAAYCKCVKDVLPVIILLNDNKKNYENLLRLFMMWNSRLDKVNLLKSRKEIEKKLLENKDVSINPIGVD